MTLRNLRPKKPRRHALANNRTEELELMVLHAYRVRDVCRLTGLGRSTIYAAIAAGDLAAQKSWRSMIVSLQDLQAFLANRRKQKLANDRESRVAGKTRFRT
jgi:excisionase family DNA binding protein